MLQCCDHPVTEKINGDPKDYSEIKMVPQYFISIKKKNWNDHEKRVGNIGFLLIYNSWVSES